MATLQEQIAERRRELVKSISSSILMFQNETGLAVSRVGVAQHYTNRVVDLDMTVVTVDIEFEYPREA